MKHSSSPSSHLKSGYRFVIFKTVIDNLPVSKIKETAEHYKECIAWDLCTGTLSLNFEIQHILIFLDFLDSHSVPLGISTVELEFYRRTAQRMVCEGFLPANVIEQFNKPKSVLTSSNTEKDKEILTLAI